MRPPRQDLARATFAVLAIGLLLGSSLWILRPFIGPAIWATMVVVATWPLMRRVQAALGGRRGLAVALMTLLLVLGFVVPLTLALVTIVQNADTLAGWARLVSTWRLTPEAPAWLAALPMVGDKLAALWSQSAAAGLDGLLAHLTPYAGNLTRWLVGQIGSLGFLLLQFFMTVVIAAIMYAGGEAATDQARRFAIRLAGERGASTLALAGDAIRGVALGVGITALVQAVLGGIGLALVGVPVAGLLSALMFMLCIAQIGPTPVLVPAVIWVYWNGEIGWGSFLLVWSLAVTLLDNVLRPALIRLGADLPLLLIFAGVIGGLLAFGLVGIFVGPVVLAVAYTLLESWIDEGDPATAGPAAGGGTPDARATPASPAPAAPAVAAAPVQDGAAPSRPTDDPPTPAS